MKSIKEEIANIKQTNKVLKFIAEMVQLLIGTVFMSFAISFFLFPNQLSTGGFVGIATAVNHIFGFPVGTLVLILNIPLFIMAFIKNGKEIFVKAIFGTVFLSIFIDFFSQYHPVTNDKLLASVYGGILIGLGLAMVFKASGSTGGTDLLTRIIKAFRPEKKLGEVMVMMDAVIVFGNMLVFRQIEIGLYSAIAIFIVGRILDVFFEGVDFTKTVYIISDKAEEISKKIGEELKRGTTGIYGKGMYRGEEKLILLCVADRNELPAVNKITKKIDPRAFIIISNAREVIGEGFKNMG